MTPVIFRVDRSSATPLFSQLAQTIASDVRRGRLRPGQRLPGSRVLAEQLGVHRNTVLAALAELRAQGWLEAQPARGTFVCTALPEVQAAQLDDRKARDRTQPGYRLPPCTLPPAAVETRLPQLTLAGGTPDARLFPRELLARAIRRALRQHGELSLDYGDAQGVRPLRRALARLLSERRAMAVGEDDVLITRGSQMALWLVAQALLRPGDRVAVEAWGYRPAWQALQSSGATLCPVAVDAGGLNVDSLAELARAGRLRAVYVTPHHQFPTMATLAAERRLHLLRLAKRYQFAIVEDDYDNEYHFSGQPLLPLASHDPHGNVVYVGSLSKVLAPGLRIGFCVAPRPVLEHMVRQRIFVDRQGDATTELAIAELLEEDEVQRHVRRTKRIYRGRRDELAEQLVRCLGKKVSFRVPDGGMAFWVRFHGGISVEKLAEACLKRGVAFTPGREFGFAPRRSPFARFGFARVNEAEIRRALRIVASQLS